MWNPIRPALWRDAFDRPRRVRPLGIVIIAGVITAAAFSLMYNGFRGACTGLPESMIRLEAAFRAWYFADLLLADGRACAARMVDSFWSDSLFALAYGALLVVLFLWAERWRRYAGPGSPIPIGGDYAFRPRLILAAGAIAALFDCVVENPTLYFAGVQTLAHGGTGRPWEWLVVVGSLAAVAKWLLLLIWGWGIISELIAGPRGAVLRRVRFSVLAVLLGALPLLAIPQGQDMLRRLVEGEHPFVRAFFCALALTFAAYIVWRCGRVLVEFRLDDKWDWKTDSWGAHFAEHIPRILAGALLVLGAAAMAREANDFLLMLALLLLSGALVILLGDRVGTLGRGVLRLAPRSWQNLPLFDGKTGSAVIGIVVSLGLLWRHRRGLGGGISEETALAALDLGAWLCIVGSFALTIYVYSRRPRELRKSEPNIAPAEFDEKVRMLQSWSFDAIDVRLGTTPRFRRPVIMAIAVSLAVLVAFMIAPVSIGRALGPLWILALFVANTVFLGSIAVWIHLRYGIPIVRLGLALSLVSSVWNDNHRIATMKAEPADRSGPRPAPLARYRPLNDHITEWMKARAGVPTDSGPIVLVAAAGGGLRAAYWAAIALATLQDADTTFARNVLAISGVSGGSIGATLFDALLKDAARGDTTIARGCPRGADTTSSVSQMRFASCIRGVMAKDFLSPDLAAWSAPDLLQRFIPVPIPAADRSRAFEASWSAAYADVVHRPTFDQGLLDLADSAPTLPTLLINATHVETGRRYVASSYSVGGVLEDVGDVLREAGSDLPLHSAAHNSARFTYVSPAGHLITIDGQEGGRLVDGGYFENSGLVTLHEIYDAIRTRDSSARVVVVYLCNDPANCWVATPGSGKADSVTKVRSTSVNELLAPARAILHTRDARASLARTEFIDALGPSFIQLNVCPSDVPLPPIAGSRRLSTDASDSAKARARAVTPPLGWLLSEITRRWMDGSIERTHHPEDGACRSDNVRGLMRLDSLRKLRRNPAIPSVAQAPPAR